MVDVPLTTDFVALQSEIVALTARVTTLEKEMSVKPPVTPPVAPPVVPPALKGLAALINAAGSTLTLPAGTMRDSALVTKPMTITGAGMGKTIIDATGLSVVYGKAILVPMVGGVLIENLSLTGAAVPDMNGAGVRQNSPADFSLRNVEIYGCQDGILTFPGMITLDGCHIHDNGVDGQSHNIYANGLPTTTLTLTNSLIEHAKVGHEVKSRAGTTIINGCTINSSTGSRCLDICDGGKLEVTNTILIKEASATNRVFLGYAEESIKNGILDVTFTGCTFVNGTMQTCYMQAGPLASTAVLNLVGCKYMGAKPVFQGWAKVNES